MAQAGYEPVLKKSPWCLLKRPANLTDKQRLKMRELLAFNLKSVRAYLLKEQFQESLGLRLAHVGRQVPRSVVPRCHALQNRTDEEVRSYRTYSSRVAAQLFPRP
jgi:hypothetical protein